MIDIQNTKDERKIGIDKVGIKDIKYPIIVLDKKNKKQHTVAKINMYVNLSHQFKGTHMSRFIGILNIFRGEITLKNMHKILVQMLSKLDATRAHFEIFFPYFIEKEAPVSKEKSFMEYQCSILGKIRKSSDLGGNELKETDFVLGVKVPVMSLCPCSKSLAKNGAHNQRSIISIKIRSRKLVWIEDLVVLAESCASCPVYSLLKREDEKYLTEKAYENPLFVEDIVRNVAVALEKKTEVIWFNIESESFESIHNHSAYAQVERMVGGTGIEPVASTV